MFPNVDGGDPALAVLVTTSGGLTGGDSVRVVATAARGAAVTITSQAAEKLYRSLGADIRIDVALDVAEDAYLEYLPQETIIFDGARVMRRTRVQVAPRARFLACDMLVFGRAAHGERLREGKVYDAWRISQGPELLWADALALEGDIAQRLDSPFTFAAAESLATAVYVGTNAMSLLPFARKLAETGASRGGATIVRGTLLARFFGTPAAAVRADLARYMKGIRAALGWPARLPRMWSV
jgi:urease accessory protein